MQRAVALRRVVLELVGAQLEGDQVGGHRQLRDAPREVDAGSRIDADLRGSVAGGCESGVGVGGGEYRELPAGRIDLPAVNVDLLPDEPHGRWELGLAHDRGGSVRGVSRHLDLARRADGERAALVGAQDLIQLAACALSMRTSLRGLEYHRAIGRDGRGR